MPSFRFIFKIASVSGVFPCRVTVLVGKLLFEELLTVNYFF